MTIEDKPAETTPKETPTLQIPKADPVLVLVQQMKQAMEAGFRETNANITLVTGDLNAVKAEVRAIQTWKGEQDARADSNSLRAKQSSQADEQQAKQLAEEKAAREALAAKVDTLSAAVVEVLVPILQRIDGLTKNPLVKVLVVLATAVLGSYAATKGLK